ncbi:unnamed protein product [Protopolystoma xenopodis]|uniref:Uncharacterized protein n=1 Tax=Protopolystoma xenopodis TaxID=117903 RepID=A0A3S5AU67_9PLAT|nr:unnamed protein product [Protopolystoma xenopodis]
MNVHLYREDGTATMSASSDKNHRPTSVRDHPRLMLLFFHHHFDCRMPNTCSVQLIDILGKNSDDVTENEEDCRGDSVDQRAPVGPNNCWPRRIRHALLVRWHWKGLHHNLSI